MSDFEDRVYDYGLAPGEAFEPDDLAEEPFDLAEPHVMTALGPIDPGALGFALHHEHVIRKPRRAGADDPDRLLDNPGFAIAELEGFFMAGGRAVVDMTPADDGRDIAEIAWVAQHAPVHLVVVTGHGRDERAAPFVGEQTADEIAARLVAELTEGIGGTETKAGLITAGTSLNRITPVEERVLRAAARAHLATGVPISTTTERGTMALEQLAILREEGVDPGRVVIGQLDAGLDEPTVRSILETGAFVSFDQWSRSGYVTDGVRAAMVKRLVDAGHLEQILISGDLARRSSWLSYGGGPGFVYFVEQIPLLLMEAGLTAPQVRQIFVENPARALTIERTAGG